MIRRPPRSTPLYSSAASDVYKRQDIGNYDADDAMLEFAERYFNAQPAQFSYSALVRTVSIVTRKSLNVSVRFFFI